jgi:1-acyl-sn-glycerol-3-phosphate acyltransferase
LFKAFTIILFTIMGWKIEGKISPEIKKCILVAAPHTSNFDFLLAMASFYKLKLPVKYLIKKEWLNFWPLRRIFRNSGALGVDRSKNSTMVDSLAELITASKDNLAIMISPEGTRKLVHRWKTGFYYTALKAKVPIVLSHLDYRTKTAAIGLSFMPCGCYRKDMIIIKNYYKEITPKFPENFSLEIYFPDIDALCAG